MNETTVIRRQPRRPDGAGITKPRSFPCPEDVWQRALAAAHKNGVSLSSQLVRMADEYASANGC